MTLNGQEYDYVLALAVEEAQGVIAEKGEGVKNDEDKFHDLLFDRVLTEVDRGHYSYLEAKDVSEVCGEVEGDILHGDILGL
jgi:hypothetical protein